MSNQSKILTPPPGVITPFTHLVSKQLSPTPWVQETAIYPEREAESPFSFRACPDLSEPAPIYRGRRDLGMRCNKKLQFPACR